MSLFLGKDKITECNVKFEGSSISGTDTSDATLTSGSQMLEGISSYSKGIKYIGTIPIKTENDVTISKNVVTIPSGDYQSDVSKTLPVNTLATPTITVSTSGLITAKETQSDGYVEASTKSATKQLTTQAAQTITPGTSDKTIAANVYTTGIQTIKGDSNLIPENILSTATIFGVNGSVVIQKYYTGSTEPDNSIGSNGDLYFMK